MMDRDDDPEDEEVPTCVEKQTGCDDNERLVNGALFLPILIFFCFKRVLTVGNLKSSALSPDN